MHRKASFRKGTFVACSQVNGAHFLHMSRIATKALRAIFVCTLIWSFSLNAEIRWNLVQTDSFGREFEISLVTDFDAPQGRTLPTKHDIVGALSKNLIISLEGENPEDSLVTLTPRGSVVKVSVKATVSRKQTQLRAQISNTLTTVSGNALTLVPEIISIPVASYPVATEDGQATKIVSYILRSITIVTGSLILVNSFCNINGVLLLKFIQMLDFINFFVLLNVNFREVVETVFKALYSLSQNNFLLIPIPIDFDSIPNQFEKYRGKLTEMKVSPVLLQHQLPETVFFFILVFASLLFKFFRFGGLSSRFSNFVNTMTFGYTQMILVEQFFYSLYQLTSSYNYKTYIPSNIISYAGAMLSLVIISKTIAEIWTQVREENFFAGTKINEVTKPQFKVTKIDTLTHIKEFISTDIQPRKLRLLTARLYNPLFMMRFIVMGVATLSLQGYPFYQLLLMAAYNLMLLILTLYLVFRAKIFESKWISAQRIFQELLINLKFILFIVSILDESMYFISLEASSIMSLVVIIALILAITVEFFFFSIHFIRSILLTYSNFKLYLFKCKQKKPATPKPMSEAGSPINDKRSKKSFGEKLSPVLASPGLKIVPKLSDSQSPMILFAKRGSSSKENTEASTFAVTAKNSPKFPIRLLKTPVSSSFATPIKQSATDKQDQPVPKIPFPKVVNNNFVGEPKGIESNTPSSTHRLLMRHSERFGQGVPKNSPPQPSEQVEMKPFSSPQKKPRTISVDQYNLIQTPATVGAPGSALRKDAILGIKSGKQVEPRRKLNQYVMTGRT